MDNLACKTFATVLNYFISKYFIASALKAQVNFDVEKICHPSVLKYMEMCIQKRTKGVSI